MFSEQDKIKILKLKSSIASYYNLQMKKIGDRQLEALFYENCIISGGCISSLFHDEAVKDIDVYATSSKAVLTIKDYIINTGKNIKSVEAYDIDANANKVTKTDKQIQLITDNAVTLTNDVQFIYMDTWENCKKKFDFIHCQPHYDLTTQKLYISEAQFNAIKNKQLIPTGLVEVKDKRLNKYTKRGWGMETIKSVPFSWSELNVPGIVAQEIDQIVPGISKIIPTVI